MLFLFLTQEDAKAHPGRQAPLSPQREGTRMFCLRLTGWGGDGEAQEKREGFSWLLSPLA